MKVGILWHPKAFEINTAIFDGTQINTYTGHNTGNMAYVEGIKNIVNASEYQFFPWGVKEKDIPSDVELLIFPAANQLGAHTELGDLADNFLAYGRPIVAIGLGAQFKNVNDEIILKDGTRRWLDVLCQLAPKQGVPNIITRGDFTASVLSRLGYDGSFISAGCPSQFINLDASLYSGLNDHMARSDLYSLTYNTSHYAWAWARHLDREAYNYIRLNAGGMVVQAPGEFIDLVKTRNEKTLNSKFQAVRSYYDDNASDAEFVKALKKHFFTFPTASSWRSWLAHCDFNYGTRIHGTMLSLQSEVPSFLIVHDTRTEELAQKMGVPHVHYKDIPADGNVVQFVKDYLRGFNFEFTDSKRKANSLQYSEFFEGNGIPKSAQFAEFIDQASKGGKEVSEKISYPISLNFARMIHDDARVCEVYETQSSLPANRRYRSDYIGLKRRDVKVRVGKSQPMDGLRETVVFSANSDHIGDLIDFLELTDWRVRQVVLRCESAWVKYIVNSDLSGLSSESNEVLLESKQRFFDLMKDKGFSLKSLTNAQSVSEVDSAGRVVLSMAI